MLRTIGNYREFTLGLAGLGLLLLVIIIMGAAGWPGDRNTCYQSTGHCYCENIDQAHPERSAILDHPGMFAQPVNTWSNVGFMLIGLAMLWWIGWERATGRPPGAPQSHDAEHLIFHLVRGFHRLPGGQAA
jgi:hypothetical protein